MGYSPWGCKELDMTEQLHIHTHIRHKHLNTYACFFVPALYTAVLPVGRAASLTLTGGRDTWVFFVSRECHSENAGCEPGVTIVSEPQVLKQLLELFGRCLEYKFSSSR